MTTCTKCKEEKEDWKFSVDNSRSNGLKTWCRECQRIYRLQNPDRGAKDELWRRYGLTLGQYELMLKSQNGVCKICGRTETRKLNEKVTRLCVDHCHKTQKVRGLLCYSCNTKLGHIEDKEWLRKAQEYLAKV